MGNDELSLLLGIETDDALISAQINKIKRILKDNLKSQYIDIELDEASLNKMMNSVKVVDSQFDEEGKALKKLTVAIDTATGKLKQFQFVRDKTGQMNLNTVKEVSNVNKMASAYVKLNKQLAEEKGLIRTLQNKSIITDRDTQLIDQYTKHIDLLNKEIAELKSNMSSSGHDFGNIFAQSSRQTSKIESQTDKKILSNDQKELNSLIRKGISLEKSFASELSKMAKASENNTQARQQYVSTLSRELDAVNRKIREIENSYRGTQNEKAIGIQTENYRKELSLIKQKTDATNSTNNTLFNGLSTGWKDAVGNVSRYMAAYQPINLITDAIRNSIQTIRDLNVQFTDIQMVTENSKSQINELAKSYGNLAYEMGTTITAIAGGASEWLRQGKSVAETNNLLKQSSILSVVGDMDPSAASEALTSTLNGQTGPYL